MFPSATVVPVLAKPIRALQALDSASVDGASMSFMALMKRALGALLDAITGGTTEDGSVS